MVRLAAWKGRILDRMPVGTYKAPNVQQFPLRSFVANYGTMLDEAYPRMSSLYSKRFRMVGVSMAVSDEVSSGGTLSCLCTGVGL